MTIYCRLAYFFKLRLCSYGAKVLSYCYTNLKPAPRAAFTQTNWRRNKIKQHPTSKNGFRYHKIQRTLENYFRHAINHIRLQKMHSDTKSIHLDLRHRTSTQHQSNRTSENGFRHNINQIGFDKMDFDAKSNKLDLRN